MLNLRLALNVPENRLLHISKEGRLEGLTEPSVREAIIYFFTKVNTTWIHPDSDLKTSSQIAIANLKKIAGGEADGAYNILTLNNGLSENVTIGKMVYETQCKLASSPMINSVVFQDGPESALKQMNLNFFLLTFTGLAIMIYFTQVAQSFGYFLNSVWILYTSLLRRPVQAAISGFYLSVLILSTLLIQTLYNSFLHTDRTSMTDFIHIDSLSDIHRHKMTLFVFDISACQDLAGADDKLQVIPLVKSFAGGQDFSWCIASGKCALVLNDLDQNLLLSFGCSLDHDKVIRNPPYFSSPLKRGLSGYAFNKKFPKKQLDRIDGYIQRSFEMGLVKKNGFFSKDFSAKTARTLTQSNANEECLSKRIQNSISTPAPLSNQFFKNCYLLYCHIALAAITIRLFSLISMGCFQSRDRQHQSSVGQEDKKVDKRAVSLLKCIPFVS